MTRPAWGLLAVIAAACARNTSSADDAVAQRGGSAPHRSADDDAGGARTPTPGRASNDSDSDGTAPRTKQQDAGVENPADGPDAAVDAGPNFDVEPIDCEKDLLVQLVRSGHHCGKSCDDAARELEDALLVGGRRLRCDGTVRPGVSRGAPERLCSVCV
jgi:hypothetical protein